MTSWEDLDVGAQGPTRSFGPIDRTDIVRYEGASGFYNPIHHDEGFALAAGFPAPVSVGMFQAGVWASWAAAWLGPENVRRVRFRFHGLVFPGDVLVCSGEVVARHEVDGQRLVEVHGSCARQGAGVAVAGEATFVVPGGAR